MKTHFQMSTKPTTILANLIIINGRKTIAVFLKAGLIYGIPIAALLILEHVNLSVHLDFLMEFNWDL